MGTIAAVSWDAGPTGAPDAGATGVPDGPRFHGHTDPGGRGDSGATVLDLRGPRGPGAAGFLPDAPGHRNLHLQVVGGLPLVVADAGIADDWADQVTCPWVSDICGADAGSVVTFPPPAGTVHRPEGAHSGPHDLHESGSGSFVSEHSVSATDQDVEVYVTDRDAGRYVLQYDGA